MDTPTLEETTAPSPWVTYEKTNPDYDEIDSDFDVLPGRRINQIVSKEKQKLRTFVNNQRMELKLKMENPPAMKMRDKLSFVFGIIDVCACAFLLGGYPQFFIWKHLIQLPILTFVRWILYYKQKHHYFLLDFCYFANFCVALNLLYFNDSCNMFYLSFSFTAGPLTWAVGVWRNSMVFHSLDKITSLFIHVSPSLAVWAMRWKDPSGIWNQCSKEEISFYDATIFPLIPYILWQLGYFVIVQVIRRNKFKADKERLTSFLWMKQDTKHVVNKAMNIFGPKYSYHMFGVLQLIYTFVVMLPIKIFYQSFWAHTIWLTLVIIISAWNGSSFYFEVFSKRYQNQLEEYQKNWATVSEALKANPSTDSVKVTSETIKKSE
eukprot:TRINITY_DN7636_c0_g1_i1.p1 TRINITY_DN7636_c0_g1~~TRINITY_DN7636_c0_g1_i1.p1  ORF type:complete len:389 (-),score=103.94 TRINITY_DN7636_c0_g1_i1:53-1183(-)